MEEHYTLTRMTKIKRNDNIKSWQGFEAMLMYSG